MAKVKDRSSIETELKRAIDEAFVKEALEGECINVRCWFSDGRLCCLMLNLSISGSGRDEDQGGREISPKWKRRIGNHADKMLNALLEAIRRFCAERKDCPTRVRVTASYANFGVRRHHRGHI